MAALGRVELEHALGELARLALVPARLLGRPLERLALADVQREHLWEARGEERVEHLVRVKDRVRVRVRGRGRGRGRGRVRVGV